jgi:uncharacterized protein YndB with AHSA1/START domain
MNESNGVTDWGESGVTIVRVFDAARERIWAEWTEPERFADWYGGPDAEVPVDSVSMDVRDGGAWRATMFAGPDRREIQWTGDYLDVAFPRLLVLTVTDELGDEPRDVVTVLLTELGGGRTEMLFRQRGGMTTEQYGRAGSGWGMFFDRMQERLSA